MAEVKIAHGNVLNHRQAARLLMATQANAVGFNEAHRINPWLDKTFRGYRMYGADPVRKAHPKGYKRLVSTDVATMVKKKHEHLGEWSQQVSQQVNTKELAGVAPDRWFNVAAFRLHGRPTIYLNMHPNAGPKALHGKNAKHPIVREYAESMEWMDAVLTMYLSQGYAVLGGGDMNMLDKEHDPKWSPYPVLTKHGLGYRAHGIDVQFWSNKHYAPQVFRVVPKTKFGSDHDALVMTLRTK